MRIARENQAKKRGMRGRLGEKERESQSDVIWSWRFKIEDLRI